MGTTFNGGPAFPAISTEDYRANPEGMSKRLWLAGQALPAIITRCTKDTALVGETMADMFARRAFEVADAVLAAEATREG